MHTPHVFRSITQWLLAGLVFLLPLFLLPWNIDVLELNKQTLLVLVVAVASLTHLTSTLLERRLTGRSGWSLLAPSLFFLATVIAAIFSVGGYSSWIGSSLQHYQSVLTTGFLLLLFILITQTTNDVAQERRLFTAVIFSGFIGVILGTLSLVGLPVFPWAFAQSGGFSTIGTVNALGVFAIVVTIFGNALWLVSGRETREVLAVGMFGIVQRVLILTTTAATAFLLLAIDFWVLWVILLLGSALLFVFGLARANEFPHHNRFFVSIALVILSLFFLVLPRPFTLPFPVEVTPTFSASMQIAGQTFKEHGLLTGSGPGTYAFNYSRFRDPSVNQTAFWDTRFDRGHSYATTLLATHGLLGLLAFLGMILFFLVRGVTELIVEKDHESWKLFFVLFSSWTTLAASSFLYSWNMTLIFLFFFLSALLAKDLMGRPIDIPLKRDARARLATSFLFIVFAFAVIVLFFVAAQRLSAENAYAKALRMDRSGETIDLVVEQLNKAAQRNRFNDIYFRTLSEALLFNIQSIAEENTLETLEAEDAQFLQQLVSASINSAKRATDLSPHNVQNWRMRGTVYREVLPLVQNADVFAQRSFERAIELEPSNPLNHIGAGRTELVISSLAGRLLDSENPEIAADAAAKQEVSLAQAEVHMNTAIQLKPDYAPAHYWFAVTLQEQGRLDEAYERMSAIASGNPFDVGVFFQLGLLALQTERPGEAQIAFERALELVPNYANAQWFLASALEGQGNLEGAIHVLEELQKRQPNEAIRLRLEALREGLVQAQIPQPLEEEPEAPSEESL